MTFTDEQATDAPPVEMVTLTIDDQEVSVPKGTLVIRAAELIGVQIPRFCDHPLLDPVGAWAASSMHSSRPASWTLSPLGSASQGLRALRSLRMFLFIG